MKFKRIYFYVIGLILIGMTILFSILILIKNNNFTKETSLNITYYNKSFKEDFGFSLNDFLETKKFKTITLSGIEKIDRKLLNKFQLEVKKIVKSNDSIIGIHLILNKKTKYEEVIRAFEICEIEKAKVYIPNGYDIWVTNYATNKFGKIHPMEPPNE
jgi:hypothetical protein